MGSLADRLFFMISNSVTWFARFVLHGVEPILLDLRSANVLDARMTLQIAEAAKPWTEDDR
jgi:hypothetical protein